MVCYGPMPPLPLASFHAIYIYSCVSAGCVCVRLNHGIQQTWNLQQIQKASHHHDGHHSPAQSTCQNQAIRAEWKSSHQAPPPNRSPCMARVATAATGISQRTAVSHSQLSSVIIVIRHGTRTPLRAPLWSSPPFLHHQQQQPYNSRTTFPRQPNIRTCFISSSSSSPNHISSPSSKRIPCSTKVQKYQF